MNFCDLAVSGVTDLAPYVPGKPIEELQRQYGLKDVIKLASNENPMGPSQAVQAAIARNVAQITRYPDGNGYQLKLALSEHYGIAAEQITLGKGSNDVLEMVARAFVSQADEVIFSEHAFAVYGIVTQAIGATPVVTSASNYGHDLAAMAAAVSDKTKLIFIANPNNPTGTYVDPAEVYTFMQQIPERVLVVLDEAYYEFSEQSADTFRWLESFPNLIICRTFSKAYGLAGLRVGFGVSHPQVADLMNRVRQPFNVSHLAQIAAVAALGDNDYLVKSRALNEAGLEQLCDGFEQLSLDYIPSYGNFVAVNVGRDAAPVYENLLREGVIVRPIGAYGMPEHLRISVGLEQENAYCLEALTKVLA